MGMQQNRRYPAQEKMESHTHIGGTKVTWPDYLSGSISISIILPQYVAEHRF